jgi:BirA family transcriptional regulator, biotin operon repressor / biotin---[acetyl-CoA-carboxylase] ligase
LINIASRTGSTNADLLAQLRAGEHVAEGTWLVADRQDAGRGRQGRTWFDGAGNFMGSTVVHRHASDPPASSLALLAGLTLYEVIAPLVPPPHRAELKWPNDVLIAGAKLAGILLEAEGTVVVVGIGVNLAAAPELDDRCTVALSAFGPAPDRDTFAITLARQFVIEVERWRSFGIESIVRRWLAAGHPPGTALQVGEPDEQPLAGTFAGLSADGALQLTLADGTTRTIHAGEVRLAGGN